VLPAAHDFLVFLAAGLALNFTPGPDMLYVAARSSSGGRGVGVVSALGIGAGTLVHISALALGLSAVLVTVPAAYAAVRYAGAAYLVFLGVRALLRPRAISLPARAEPAGSWRAFRQGMLTNILNPKVALFFLAFLPQFVDPARGSAAAQTVVLGLVFDTTGTAVNIGVAILASRATEWWRRRPRGADWLQRATGLLFLGLGARLAFAAGR